MLLRQLHNTARGNEIKYYKTMAWSKNNTTKIRTKLRKLFYQWCFFALCPFNNAYGII